MRTVIDVITDHLKKKFNDTIDVIIGKLGEEPLLSNQKRRRGWIMLCMSCQQLIILPKLVENLSANSLITSLDLDLLTQSDTEILYRHRWMNRQVDSWWTEFTLMLNFLLYKTSGPDFILSQSLTNCCIDTHTPLLTPVTVCKPPMYFSKVTY